jgi:RHS repeat-associated protein
VGGSSYDSQDRLVNWQRSDNNLTQAWNLSLVGDWNNITENSQTQSRTHGPTHELLAVAGQAVQHDVKGNMTLIPANLRPTTSGTPQPLSMFWDFDNRLVSADTKNDSTADVFYKWDVLGRRVYRDDGTTATVYVQSGQRTIADYTAGTTATSPTYTYVYASYIDEPVMRSGSGNLVYLHRNQQYSIIALTGGSGTVVERYAYTAYGTPTITDASSTVLPSSANNNRYTYTGREWDSQVSFYHYRARMYESASGRFCSRDPIGYVPGPALYEFVGGNSVSYMDPSGNDRRRANPVWAQLPPCYQKFLHLLMPVSIDIDIIGPVGVAGKLDEFRTCYAQEIAKPARTPKTAAEHCAVEVGLEGVAGVASSVPDFVASVVCCEVHSGNASNGDPCEEGSTKGPGTKPNRCEPWDHTDPSDPKPKFCQDCCDFRYCVWGVKKALELKLPKKPVDVIGTYIEGKAEHETCLAECSRAGGSN